MANMRAFKEVVFTSEEASFGAAKYPSASDGIKFNSISIDPGQEIIEKNAQRSSSRSRDASLNSRRMPTVEISQDISPSAAAGTAGDMAKIWKTTFTEASATAQSAIQESPAPTTTGCTVAALHGIATGDVVGIPVGDFIYPRKVTVSTNALSWSEAVPAAPTAGDNVDAMLEYTLADAPTNSVTIWRGHESAVQGVSGCKLTAMTLGLGSGDVSTVEYSFRGKEYMYGEPLTTAEALDDSEVECDVVAAYGYVPIEELIDSTQGVFGQIDDEVVKITEYDRANDTVTIVRAQAGTGAAAHDTASTISLYLPTQTIDDEPIPSAHGGIIFDGEEIEGYSLSVDFSDTGVKYRDNLYGKETADGAIYPAKRVVDVTLSIPYATAKNYASKAHGRTTIELIAWAGRSVGKTVAVKIPQLEIEPFDIEEPDGDEAAITITGHAIDTSDANGEMSIYCM